MRNPLSKMVAEMEPSGIRRFFDVASTMDNVISLGVGEPDFDTPWHIREEGITRWKRGARFIHPMQGFCLCAKKYALI